MSSTLQVEPHILCVVEGRPMNINSLLASPVCRVTVDFILLYSPWWPWHVPEGYLPSGESWRPPLRPLGCAGWHPGAPWLETPKAWVLTPNLACLPLLSQQIYLVKKNAFGCLESLASASPWLLLR